MMGAMKPLPCLIAALALATACTAPADYSSLLAPNPWVAEFDPPRVFETDRVRLEPLAGHHAELDYAALMGSREHLRRTLQWGDWPADDFTLEENRGDLEGHWEEFEAREAYAYTVLDKDGGRCVGCIYMNPVAAPDGSDQRSAAMAFWVIEEELESDLDVHLLENVLPWLHEKFPLDWVGLLIHVDDTRGLEVMERMGLAEDKSPSETHRVFSW